MSEERVKVTCFDPKTGEEEIQELPPDSYILICGEKCYISYQQFFPKSGTTQLTIKRGV